MAGKVGEGLNELFPCTDRPKLSEHWVAVKDGNLQALEIMKRHYSWHEYKDGRKHTLFVGPGEKMVLVTKDYDALFVWRKFRSADRQVGVNCSVFRNESSILSSMLIKEAMQIAWNRWKGERLFTYVNAKKIKSQNPGACFKKAGWRRCGITKVNKLLILEAVQ